MRMGDYVKVIRGVHAGRKGTVINTRGSNTSNCVLVRLNRELRGRISETAHHSQDQIGICVDNLQVMNDILLIGEDTDEISY